MVKRAATDPFTGGLRGPKGNGRTVGASALEGYGSGPMSPRYHILRDMAAAVLGFRSCVTQGRVEAE